MVHLRGNIYTKISLEKYFFDLTFTDFQMDHQKVVIILEKNVSIDIKTCQ